MLVIRLLQSSVWMVSFDRAVRRKTMPMIHVSDHTKQMIDRFVAEGRAADASACIDDAMRLYDEQSAEGTDNLDYVIEQAKRGIADIEAGLFTTISSPEEAEAFWSAMSARVDKRIAERRANGGNGTTKKTA